MKIVQEEMDLQEALKAEEEDILIEGQLATRIFHDISTQQGIEESKIHIAWLRESESFRVSVAQHIRSLLSELIAAISPRGMLNDIIRNYDIVEIQIGKVHIELKKSGKKGTTKRKT
jgi:hypothetical protein